MVECQQVIRIKIPVQNFIYESVLFTVMRAACQHLAFLECAAPCRFHMQMDLPLPLPFESADQIKIISTVNGRTNTHTYSETRGTLLYNR